MLKEEAVHSSLEASHGEHYTACFSAQEWFCRVQRIFNVGMVIPWQYIRVMYFKVYVGLGKYSLVISKNR